MANLSDADVRILRKAIDAASNAGPFKCHRCGKEFTAKQVEAGEHKKHIAEHRGKDAEEKGHTLDEERGMDAGNPDYSEASVCRCGDRNQQHKKSASGKYECTECDCKDFKRV